MKKYILMLLMMIGFISTASAQIQQYRTTSYAFARVYNGRYVWGDWEDSDMTIIFNLTTDVITIYSPRIQYYRVYSTGNPYRDKDGGQQIKFYVTDQDGDRGTIRLRIQSNGTSQIYVDFNDVAWCYCVVRTQ